jgi:hypothetical protein
MRSSLEPRKFAKVLFSGSPVSGCGFTWRRESAKSYAGPFVWAYGCRESTISSRNSFGKRLRVSGLATVSAVFLNGPNAKVAPAVIQRVAVDVVDNLIRRDAENETGEDKPLPNAGRNGEVSPDLRIPCAINHGMPSALKIIGILRRNDRHMTAANGGEHMVTANAFGAVR